MQEWQLFLIGGLFLCCHNEFYLDHKLVKECIPYFLDFFPRILLISVPSGSYKTLLLNAWYLSP